MGCNGSWQINAHLHHTIEQRMLVRLVCAKTKGRGWSCHPRPFGEKLLNFGSSTSLGQLRLGGFGIFLADAFLDRLGGSLDQILGLFQAEAG